MMKKNLCVIMGLASLFWDFNNSVQKGFSISAHITGVPDSAMILLQDLATGRFLDSCLVQSGKAYDPKVHQTNQRFTL
jgi:hypothetical protein